MGLEPWTDWTMKAGIDMFDGYAGVWDFTGIGSATSMGNTISLNFVIIFVRNGTQQLLENTLQASPGPFYTLVSKGS